MIESKEASPFVHVFICTRTKENGESCGTKGSSALRDQLKNWVKDQGLQTKVKVTASLCLGHCENGITACIYPTNDWFLKVNHKDDLEKLKNEILKRALCAP